LQSRYGLWPVRSKGDRVSDNKPKLKPDGQLLYRPDEIPMICASCDWKQAWSGTPSGLRCMVSHKKIEDQNITPESTCDRWTANYWWLRRNVRYCDCSRNMTNCPDCRQRKKDNELVLNLFIVLLVWLTMVVCMFWAVTSK
jgi:hypothetical protein